MNMLGKYWMAGLLLLAAGCAKDPLPDPVVGPSLGEEVPVNMRLELTPFQDPAPAAKGPACRGLATDGSGRRVIASDHSGAMLIELVENRPDEAERPVPLAPGGPSTRVRDPFYDDEVNYYHIFQYNGTGEDAVLVKKETGTTNLTLYAGTNQRVVVLGNASCDYSLNLNDQVVGTSTYRNLLTKTMAVTSDQSFFLSTGGSEVLPFSGNFAGTITAGGTLNIPLKRNVASVDFQVKFSSGMAGYSYINSFQVHNVPNVSYWVSDRPDAVFPATVTPVAYAQQGALGTLHFNTTTFTRCAYSANGSGFSSYLYLPVNRRGSVAGTTAKQRKTNAPAGATYMRVFCHAISGSYCEYTIHLGGNFAEDYNLLPNYKYTYQVTLYRDPLKTDSRVTEGSQDTPDLP